MDEKTERWRQIAMAIFDSYVLTDIIGDKSTIDADAVQELVKDLGKKVDCSKRLLVAAIFISYGRINDNKESIYRLSDEQENFAFVRVIKHLIKRTDISLYKFENQFNALRLELNRQNPNLFLTTPELVGFIHPLYLEAIEETFKKIINEPN